MRDHRDEIAGFGPGLGLAAGLGIVSGIASVIVLVGWLQAADITGTFRPDAGGIVATVGWWTALWLALSGGVLLSLWVAYRGWRALYPVDQRVRRLRHEAREERDAVAAAEAILEGEAHEAGVDRTRRGYPRSGDGSED